MSKLVWLLSAAVFFTWPAAAQDIHQKAEVLQHDMEQRFLLEGQALCKLKLPTPERQFVDYNMPDNAYMTGIYLGTLAKKYAVTKAPEDLQKARETLQALVKLCTVSGRKGLLARAFWPIDRPMADDGVWRESPDGKYRWRGDVSTDQMDGTVYGFAFAYDLFANEEEKRIIAETVTSMADYIEGKGRRIYDIDDQPTQWGRYMPEHVRTREKMNALLWLQIVKVAHHVSGEQRFADLYQKCAIDEGYADIAVEARRTVAPQRVNHSDDVLLFLAYEPLLHLEKDPALRERYLRSLRRTWEGSDGFPGVKPEGNAYYNFVVAKYMDDASGLEAGLNTLQWFPLDIKWNTATIQQYEKQFSFTFAPTIKSPEPAAGAPTPIDRREKDWSVWVQNPYRSAGTRTSDNPLEFNGHDYLLAYWTGRYYGYIAMEDN